MSEEANYSEDVYWSIKEMFPDAEEVFIREHLHLGVEGISSLILDGPSSSGPVAPSPTYLDSAACLASSLNLLALQINTAVMMERDLMSAVDLDDTLSNKVESKVPESNSDLPVAVDSGSTSLPRSTTEATISSTSNTTTLDTPPEDVKHVDASPTSATTEELPVAIPTGGRESGDEDARCTTGDGPVLANGDPHTDDTCLVVPADGVPVDVLPNGTNGVPTESDPASAGSFPTPTGFGEKTALMNPPNDIGPTTEATEVDESHAETAPDSRILHVSQDANAEEAKIVIREKQFEDVEKCVKISEILTPDDVPDEALNGETIGQEEKTQESSVVIVESMGGLASVGEEMWEKVVDPVVELERKDEFIDTVIDLERKDDTSVVMVEPTGKSTEEETNEEITEKMKDSNDETLMDAKEKRVEKKIGDAGNVKQSDVSIDSQGSWNWVANPNDNNPVVQEYCSICGDTEYLMHCEQMEPHFCDTDCHIVCAVCVIRCRAQRRLQVTTRVHIACPHPQCPRQIGRDQLDGPIGIFVSKWVLGGDARFPKIFEEAKRFAEEMARMEEAVINSNVAALDTVENQNDELLSEKEAEEEQEEKMEEAEKEEEVKKDEEEKKEEMKENNEPMSFDPEVLVQLMLAHPNLSEEFLAVNADRGVAAVEEEITRLGPDLPIKGRAVPINGIVYKDSLDECPGLVFSCRVCYQYVPLAFGIECQHEEEVEEENNAKEMPTHKFCAGCVGGYAMTAISEAVIVTSGRGIKCMSENCKGIIPSALVLTCLDGPDLQLIRRHLFMRMLLAAGQQIEECEHCDLPVAVDETTGELLIFACPECAHLRCRRCQRPFDEQHVDRRCCELDAEHIQNVVAERLSEACVRKCTNCKVPYEKSEGCNKLICPKCGTFLCNVCGKAIPQAYDHFNKEDGSCKGQLHLDVSAQNAIKRNQVLDTELRNVDPQVATIIRRQLQ